jgi:DNA primase catalytic core
LTASKQSTDLAALIRAAGVELKRKGKQLVGLCPFHNDREPSLIVDPKKQLWNCLGACAEGGDVYKWVMKRDGVDFKAAHRRLSALALLAPGQGAKEDDEPKTESGVNDLLWLSRVVEHYHRRLLETPAAQDYLRSRGITAPGFATTFRIGYADGTLLQVISPEGRAALKKIGVISESGRELMSGCVIFPLLDAASGQAVNLYDRYAGKHESLYLPGAQHLYLPGVRRGVFNPQGARNTDEVIVTESVIDAAAVWSAGLRNVLPVYGVNGLTDEIVAHLRECRVKRVALALDSDNAGEYAAQRFGERLKEINVAARA